MVFELSLIHARDRCTNSAIMRLNETTLIGGISNGIKSVIVYSLMH